MQKEGAKQTQGSNLFLWRQPKVVLFFSPLLFFFVYDGYLKSLWHSLHTAVLWDEDLCGSCFRLFQLVHADLRLASMFLKHHSVKHLIRDVPHNVKNSMASWRLASGWSNGVLIPLLETKKQKIPFFAPTPFLLYNPNTIPRTFWDPVRLMAFPAGCHLPGGLQVVRVQAGISIYLQPNTAGTRRSESETLSSCCPLAF